MTELVEQYRTLYERFPEAIFLVDAVTGRYVDANPVAERLTGRPVTELRTLRAVDLILESAPERLGRLAAADSLVESGEVTFIRPDGERRTALLSGGRLNGQLLFEAACDITDRKRMEEALRRSEQDFRNSLEGSPLGVSVTGPDGELLYVNQAMLDVWGYGSFEELRSAPAGRLYPPQSYAEEASRREKSRQGKSVPSEYEVSIVRGDGEVRRLAAFRREVLWNAGTCSLVLYQDVTEQEKVRRQLQHSQVLATLGEMMAGIAHEVNNPLGSILLYSELVSMADVPPQVKRDLRVIRNEAKRAARTMTDLLAYGRQMDPRARRVDLHKVLTRVLNMRRYAERVQNIAVTTRFRDGALYVRGSTSQLAQLFMNLVLNAEEALGASKAGNVVITTQREGGWARVSVADDGVGIPEEDLDRVFYPFFTTRGAGRGAGLGLSVCYGIVISHGGLIRARSNDMGGATFTVELPLASDTGQGARLRARKEKSDGGATGLAELGRQR